jgi:hypothetical protein
MLRTAARRSNLSYSPGECVRRSKTPVLPSETRFTFGVQMQNTNMLVKDLRHNFLVMGARWPICQHICRISYAGLMAYPHHSVGLWQLVELCFFFRQEEGMVVLKTTDSLSTNPFAGPSRATPIILSLYRRASIISPAILSAVYSEPYADALTVFYRFEYHLIGEPFTNIRMPVCDLLFRRSCACAASQKKLTCTNLPSASGIPGGRSSSCPGY